MRVNHAYVLIGAKWRKILIPHFSRLCVIRETPGAIHQNNYCHINQTAEAFRY